MVLLNTVLQPIHSTTFFRYTIHKEKEQIFFFFNQPIYSVSPIYYYYLFLTENCPTKDYIYNIICKCKSYKAANYSLKIRCREQKKAISKKVYIWRDREGHILVTRNIGCYCYMDGVVCVAYIAGNESIDILTTIGCFPSCEMAMVGC